MSQYGGAFRPDPSYGYGGGSGPQFGQYSYGGGGQGLRYHGRLDEKSPGVLGESAAYDMHPEHFESKTLYNYPTGAAEGAQSYRRDHGYGPAPAPAYGYGNGRGDNRVAERGIANFFYKKPDPMYMGPYDEYQPQISKSKVAVTVAALAAVVIGISRHKKKKAADKCQDANCEDRPREARRRHHSTSHSASRHATVGSSRRSYTDMK